MSDEQNQPQTTEDGHPDHQAEELIENLTPEEKKKWSEKFLQLEYYKAISQMVLQILKDFSKWAALLVSGVGTLVGGWFSLRKMAKKEKLELKSIPESQPGRRRDVVAGVRSAQAPVSTQGSSTKGRKVLADDVRKEVVVETTMASAPQPNVFVDTTVILTLVSIVLFIGMNLKMFFFDKRKKKGAP